ncbi:HD domain-containing protein [Pseudomonas subflava]|uniref:HD domain-containing protein n=1 Tax=Pseudomonas subflava TaxID=2952933 RepID=UPI002079AA15|nr:HD domain-containing protein [Pseudomonas subflava]
MDDETLKARLAFLRTAESLKNVLRSGRTSNGRRESTAEHSWRLCLMAIAFEDQLHGLDILRLLKLCVVHDLAEAIGGDIPAVDQLAPISKHQQERHDLHLLTSELDAGLRKTIHALWEEYESASTPEAQAAKALDKLETILQHNQGANPPGFDYRFNLHYGIRYMAAHPLFSRIRRELDADTCARIDVQDLA